MNIQPTEIAGARICILRYTNEILLCANIKGFESLGHWIAWLSKSHPNDAFHFHMLTFLESDECKFNDMKPSNIWFLKEPKGAQISEKISKEVEKVDFEITFQVITDAELDKLASHQESGLIPDDYLKKGLEF